MSIDFDQFNKDAYLLKAKVCLNLRRNLDAEQALKEAFKLEP